MKLEIKVYNQIDPPQQDLYVILAGPRSQIIVVGPYTSFDDAEIDRDRNYPGADVVRVAVPRKSYYRLIVPPGHESIQFKETPWKTYEPGDQLTFVLSLAEYRQRIADGWVEAPSEDERPT